MICPGWFRRRLRQGGYAFTRYSFVNRMIVEEIVLTGDAE